MIPKYKNIERDRLENAVIGAQIAVYSTLRDCPMKLLTKPEGYSDGYIEGVQQVDEYLQEILKALNIPLMDGEDMESISE